MLSLAGQENAGKPGAAENTKLIAIKKIETQPEFIKDS